jgi:hypothetical protein
MAAAGAARASAPMALVDFGKHQISRLIVGGNPVSGTSHWSRERDIEMMDYFTAANVKKLLRDCEAAGVNTWQSRGDRHILRLLREYRNEGGRIQWVAQTATELGDQMRNIRDCAAAGAIGIYHHGSATDSLWKAGQMDTVRERLKLMRDLGVRVGLCSHKPEVIDFVEEQGWDVDFYMTCLYDLTRSREEVARLAGESFKGEFFHEPDRAAMLERVGKTRKQCFVFKVYGGGRRCTSEEDRRAALKQVFDTAKAGDVIVVGMFPRDSDQVAENRRLVMECLTAENRARDRVRNSGDRRRG